MQILRLVLLIAVPIVAYLASLNIEESILTPMPIEKTEPRKETRTQPSEPLEDLYLSDDFDIDDLMNVSRRNNDSRTHK